MAIIRAWGRLQETVCPDCGRPLAVHDIDALDDYGTVFWTCTAAQAVDRDQAAWRRQHQSAHETQRKAGRNPEAGMRWTAYTQLEGPPSTPQGVIDSG